MQEGYVQKLGAWFLIKFMINNKNIYTNKISLANVEDDYHENTIQSIINVYVMIFRL